MPNKSQHLFSFVDFNRCFSIHARSAFDYLGGMSIVLDSHVGHVDVSDCDQLTAPEGKFLQGEHLVTNRV